MTQRLAVLVVLIGLVGAPVIGNAIDVVTVATLSPVVVKPGTATRIALEVTVKPGYHVQANPVENADLIPITLKIEGTQNVSIGETLYPKAKRFRLPGDGQDLVIYDDVFFIGVVLQARHNVSVGSTVSLKGSLRYQACDDRHCLFPVTLPLDLAVHVAKP